MDSENENPPTRTPRTPRTPLPTENERPPARTPLPDGYLPTIKPPAAQTKPPPASSEIQVPATQRGSKQANAQEEALPSSPHNSSQEDIPSDDRTELADNDNHIQAPDPNAELPPMDWADFQARFDKEMKKAGDEEDILWNEFDDMMLAFEIWLKAASDLDNERGTKRLKTRQRYLQISEEKLEGKKAHYEKVVHAFKVALELLGK